LGAGLGASTWGVVRALEAAGGKGTVDATWVDEDTEALGLARELVDARSGKGSVGLRVRTIRDRVENVDAAGKFDLVLACQVLSELDVGEPAATRIERHAARIDRWLQRHVDEHGALVVVEPALRDRTRHLHHVRDAVASLPGVTVFAPCLHAAPCPALAHEGDWCHEDIAVDVPRWLEPVARAAGLRREGLTFSYLVLRKDGIGLGRALDAEPDGARVRVVSGHIRTKGKREAFVCGEVRKEGALVPARARVARLDRDAREENAVWERATRGELLSIRPAPELDRPRVGASTVVRLAVVASAREDESR
jgi:hypothetical protein